ncbi:MAG TPA: phospholipase D-like domain-containing protein [Chitinophagaceae bacterium]|nr:phospholipase D-like domain-containing protein [Chitinophagaceae bacterium]
MNTNHDIDSVIAAIREQQDRLLNRTGVMGVVPGFSAEDPESLVITVIKQPGARLFGVPDQVNGIPVVQRDATALEQVEGILPLSAWEGNMMEAVPNISYVPPPAERVELKNMEISHVTCHVSPDAGWRLLKPFLEATESTLTIAMYEFYAPHIIETVKAAGETTEAQLNMILQVAPNDRDKDTEEALRESWGDRFDFTRASVSGPNRVFNNSYHTKVAVRDSSAFWLSSGNWSGSSQPEIPEENDQFIYRLGNREWHVIIEDEGLAQMYEEFIKYDMEMAKAAGEPEAAPIMPDLLVPEAFFLQPEAAAVQPHPFKEKTFTSKIKVKPLMSPDNYAGEIAKLIRSAEKSLYLQFSYIRQPSNEKFNDIIEAISEKMKEGLDVRVLVSSNQNAEHSNILITKRKWKRSMFRQQTSKMHNKGVLVDGKIAVVGSNNWSSDGTQYNRDTSLVFYSRSVAKYYTEVFLFDWDNLSKPVTQAPEIAPVLAPESGPTPPGMVRIPWQAWFND